MNLSDLLQEDIDLIQRSEGKGFTYEKLNSWGVPTPAAKPPLSSRPSAPTGSNPQPTQTCDI